MKLFLLAQAARACSVCFNDDGSGIAQGLQYGILVLLAATGLIVSALFYFIIKLEKAKTAAEEAV